jgi:pyridoxamine 5'-phosphate oxidase
MVTKMIDVKKFLNNYTQKTRHILLSFRDENGIPEIISLSSFVVKGTDTYFSISRTKIDISWIEVNPQVMILFQNENQDLNRFINITLYGRISIIHDENEIYRIGLCISRRKRIPERIGEIHESEDRLFCKVLAYEIKILDLSKGNGTKSVDVIKILSPADGTIGN